MKFKNKLIFQAGIWNNIEYKSKSIYQSFKKLKKKLPIFINYEEKPDKFIGYVNNFKFNRGKLLADITINSKRILDFMKDFKIAVVPRFTGELVKDEFKNFKIDWFGLVTHPTDINTVFKIEKKNE